MSIKWILDTRLEFHCPNLAFKFGKQSRKSSEERRVSSIIVEHGRRCGSPCATSVRGSKMHDCKWKEKSADPQHPLSSSKNHDPDDSPYTDCPFSITTTPHPACKLLLTVSQVTKTRSAFSLANKMLDLTDVVSHQTAGQMARVSSGRMPSHQDLGLITGDTDEGGSDWKARVDMEGKGDQTGSLGIRWKWDDDWKQESVREDLSMKRQPLVVSRGREAGE